MTTHSNTTPRYYLSNGDLFRILKRAIAPYRTRFFAGTFFRLAAELAFTFTPYAFSKFITLAAKRAPLTEIYFFFGLWGLSYFIRVAGQRLGRWCNNRVRERAAIDAEKIGVASLVQWTLVEHEAENSGNKIKRIQKGAEGIANILRLFQDQWIAIFTHIFVMVLVVFFIDWRIGLGLCLFIFCYWSISHPLLKRASKFAREVNAQEEEVGGFVFEIANNIRTIKVMDLFPWLKNRLEQLTDELLRRIDKRVGAFQRGGAIANTFAQATRLAFVGLIIWGVAIGKFEVGFLLLFNMYFTNLRDSSEQLSESDEEFAIARYGIARMEDLFHIASKNPERGTEPFPISWNTITLRDVSFAYGVNQVLSNLNLTIHRGERLGIVGLSGAGKSTLFKLLLKEHQHFTGDILFNTQSIRDINPQSFAEHTAVVLQDTEVFNLSLKDNIVLGSAIDADNQARLAKALEVSHVREFVEKLPQGINTLIGEKGVKLSGGERQRVGIARAVFKEPEILFMDEATSHLDVESEEKIQDSLHRFFREVTAVVIAHRLTTIKEMDRIVVIDGGKIIEEGSFAELYKQKGKFFDLWEKQKL